MKLQLVSRVLGCSSSSTSGAADLRPRKAGLWRPALQLLEGLIWRKVTEARVAESMVRDTQRYPKRGNIISHTIYATINGHVIVDIYIYIYIDMI
jgi:hypothetical protein